MDLYAKTSYELCKKLTLSYSTSFSQSINLFHKAIRNDIFAIYALVRVGDEIVDTFNGSSDEKRRLLKHLETEVYDALSAQHSANPIVHAFTLTANRYGIGADLIAPYFASMAMDLEPVKYTRNTYAEYIYGSAEVIGLMCLKVFCDGDEKQYQKLSNGAKSLGSAYQKVNFLRDIASDYNERGRVYFPGVSFESFNEAMKKDIISEIKSEFEHARPFIKELPRHSQKPVALSYAYYSELLEKLHATPADTLKQTRVRVADAKKMTLLFQTVLKSKV